VTYEDKKQPELNNALAKINRKAEEDAVIGRAQTSGMSYVDVGNSSINIDLLHIIDEEDARKAMIIPFFKVGKKLRIATLNPENEETVKILKKLRDDDYKLNINLASKSGLEEAFEHYKTALLKEEKEIVNVVEEDKLKAYEKEITKLAELKDTIGNLPPKQSLNSILVGALKTGASDIHIEPYSENTLIRFRIDGVLQTIMELPNTDMENVINELKHDSHMKLNISEEAQDGRFSFEVNNRNIDVRVSALPTIYGESLVMRLLDNSRQVLGLKTLGMGGQALRDVKEALASPNGMILNTGPTGSGKTTSLYSFINILNDSAKKIITLEDPVEYRVDGISQSQINHNIGYTFENGLRAILRQDPDVVMVGEIRDIETAEIAAQAALTGHIVLSTLHTNNAVGAIERLINMGLEPFMVAPSVTSVIAQRLSRKLCTKCRILKPLTEHEKKIMNDLSKSYQELTGELHEVPEELYSPVGCPECSHTGYHGQIGVYEVFHVNPEVEQAILDGASHHDLFLLARKNGMLTLREDGFLKVLQGITSISELMRVTADRE